MVDLSWIENLIIGFAAGLTDILPVSSELHVSLLMKLLGAEGTSLFYLFIHLSIAAALYFTERKNLVRISRAMSLARIPRARRKRPVDMKSLMDGKLLTAMLIPALIGSLFYGKLSSLSEKLLPASILMFINGIILYVPQFFPGSNKDSRMLSPLEGVYMGIGAAASVIPGISGIGTVMSTASVCGVEKSYALDLAMIINLFMSAAFAVHDIFEIINYGIGSVSFMSILILAASAAAAFSGALLAVRLMKGFAANDQVRSFSVYCWGTALFVFIVNLIA